jgi:hypothetical protein
VYTPATTMPSCVPHTPLHQACVIVVMRACALRLTRNIVSAIHHHTLSHHACGGTRERLKVTPRNGYTSKTVVLDGC